MSELNSKIPEGSIGEKWDKHKFNIRLVNPANKRKYTIIVVGTGLAGAAAAASLAELGYNVKAFTFHDSPRRAHSIAAQGGINAAKNYQNDGDSVYRLFYDTVKGGDYRSREGNVHRLAQVSVNIIDQCVAQGVPFAREYGGMLDNRSFGGALVSRTFYAKGQTGQQLLLGAYSALSRQVATGKVEMFTRTEMLDIVKIDGKARGIITRNLVTGEIESHAGHAVLLCTGGYSNVFFLSTNAMACNATAAWRAHKKGAYFANPCYTQIHPTCIPVSGDHQSKLTLMSESLRNDGRVWVPRNPEDKNKKPSEIPDADRFYYLEEKYPTFGNLVPRDVASRNAKYVCDEGLGVGATGKAVYLDFRDAIKRDGQSRVADKYGNLFDMYKQITNEDPYKVPMKIYPAPHYTMGGLWVDYNLMTNVDGLYALGEANFSDHGANRLGASALMQGLADGYFVAPYTVGDFLATQPYQIEDTSHEAFGQAKQEVEARIKKVMSINGNQTPDEIHKKLGRIMWDHCGMSRNADGLKLARTEVQKLREEFWNDVKVVGTENQLNAELEKALRIADFLELGELMIIDALDRNESCGGHFREEYEINGEAKRDDENYSYVAAWEFPRDSKGEFMTGDPVLHKEELVFENVKLTQRSYK
ncbi:fumarate reductase/succinate dehydrogenase flavoprotein subunit [Bernardetia sp. OM2101]|uniref:fumarate reductase/succinate dehydrogenase flavoprotein subunit n=1 Tax=Bernardetia sp. OM2101 TaxID=3344876 RepID=UPI0035CF94D6